MSQVTRHRCARIGLTAGALVLAASPASAYTAFFSEPDFSYLQQGIGDPYFIWPAGDFWAQEFTGTGLPSATQLTLDLNIVGSGMVLDDLDLGVFLNNVLVGSFSLMPADAGGFIQETFNFAAIAGQDFEVEVRATSTIDPGAGSYSLVVDPSTGGGSSVTILPTPSSTMLLGVAGLTTLRRRRG